VRLGLLVALLWGASPWLSSPVAAAGPAGVTEVSSQQAMPEPAGAAEVFGEGEGTPVAPEDVAAVARELNCPLCEGYNLQECPLEVCAQMRELIRQRLAAGQSVEQIRAAFVEDYGPQVLNAPPKRGVFLAAWVLPVLAILLGAVGVAAFVLRSTREAGTITRAHDLTHDEREDLTGYEQEIERMAADDTE